MVLVLTMVLSAMLGKVEHVGVAQDDAGEPAACGQSPNPTDRDEPGAVHSQLHQDIAVLNLLGCKRDGYFIDLASNAAISLSNTRKLERDYGWRGLCIEPNGKYHNDIRRIRSCSLVPFVIAAPNTSSVKFGIPRKHINGLDGGGFAGIATTRDAALGTRASLAIVTLPARPLNEVLREHNVPRLIDYFSLDVEGSEDIALSTFPWHRHTISVLTVERPKLHESSPEYKQWSQLLMSNGYRLIFSLGVSKTHIEQVWTHSSLHETPASRNHSLLFCHPCVRKRR